MLCCGTMHKAAFDSLSINRDLFSLVPCSLMPDSALLYALSIQGTGVCQDEGPGQQPPALSSGVSSHADRPLGGRSGQILPQRIPQPAALHWASYGTNAVWLSPTK